ncbi:VOC family protein [Tenggerimyces flavus]|uniref:VOC family protein n=1 Tax=Tenggerimyces flavus TaxID=1708749 RepID=A0ABV7YGR4_9ACTN|nr:VOC family protein [Tenggerimyces flavus]MBM7789333.1 putative enzyme related to lactoylglutathione lyase [Tenggerimyces flavus]
MNRVVHFEVHADDLDRAERFYTQVFGWTTQHWRDDYRLLVTGTDTPGIDGAIMQRQGPAPEPGQPLNCFSCSIDVEDIGATEKAVADAGGQQVLERMTIPGVGYVAYFTDTEGNVFGAYQSDESVA